MLVKTLISFVFLGLVCARVPANFRVQEKLEAAPRGFTKVGPASPQQTITLRLALAQSNAPGVVNALYSVSDPASSTYGQHLTKQEVCPLSSFLHGILTMNCLHCRSRTWSRPTPRPRKLSLPGFARTVSLQLLCLPPETGSAFRSQSARPTNSSMRTSPRSLRKTRASPSYGRCPTPCLRGCKAMSTSCTLPSRESA